MRQLAKHCDFHDEDFEIKLQIVCNGKSSRLRKKALREPELKLQDMIIEGRKSETSSAQASGMETKSTEESHVNVVQKGSRTCHNCGFRYPHYENRPCPAKDQTCNKCGVKGHFARVCKQKEDVSYKRSERRTNADTKPRPKSTKGRKHAHAIALQDNTDDSSDSEYAYAVRGKQPSTRIKVTINSVEAAVLVDTGASVDIIDSPTFERLQGTVKLVNTNTKIHPYGSETPLSLKGQFQALIESKKRYAVTQIYVVEGAGGNLLSAKTAQDLNLIQMVNRVSTQAESKESKIVAPPKSQEVGHVPQTKDKRIQEIIQEYQSVFQGEGKLKNTQVKLHIKDNVQPVMQPQRRIPYHLRKAVSKELEKLQDEDIIERVKDQPTPWISPTVCTPKKDGSIRLCVDMREANQAIERERHVMPTLSDFKADVNGSRFFSKIDLRQAYHQLELAPESRFITTFTTHEGLFQFKRLNYGTSSAAECFQNVLQQNLADIPGVKNIADDIIIYGKIRKDHDRALENCLKRLKELNLKAKGEKCKFLEEEIKFYGLIFTEKGTKPDPERISSLTNAPAPRSTAEVRSFLGMANTCHEYIKDYAQITGPLRELTRKNAIFQWTPSHQKACNQLKKALTQAPVMSYFDVEKRSLLIVDGSPHGISGILCQRESNQAPYKIVSYASRGLTPVESRYSQTDIEGLSLVWSIEHFRLFLIGSEFDVITDHKALESIFNNPRSKPPARVERWMLRLQPYNFNVIYKKGSQNEADFLSRHPVMPRMQETTAEKMAEHHVSFVISHAVTKAMSLTEISAETENDSVLMKVKECLKSGKWDENDPEITIYHRCSEEISFNKAENILLKGNRIIIPASLQERATQIAHSGHQGVEKTKSLMREKVWFPNLDKKVREIIDRCNACQATGQQNPPEPMRITPTPDTPLHTVAIDFKGPVPNTSEYLLVVTDVYSKYPEVEVVRSTEAKTVIPQLDKIFARHGIPAKITTDNGPPFNGKEFERYMALLGVNWKPSTPLWPQGNANAESVMKPLGKLLQSAKIENKNWRQELQKFLLSFRVTPHCTTKVAPCELLFNRTIRGKLPELTSNKVVNKHKMAKANIEMQKETNKAYYDKRKRAKEADIEIGDTVICLQPARNKLSSKFSPNKLRVTERKGSRVTARNGRYVITRNISHFKKVAEAETEAEEESEDELESSDDEELVREEEAREEVHAEQGPRRSGRTRKQVDRYGDSFPTEFV